MKHCVRCGVTKPLEEFWRRGSSPDGRARTCAECSRGTQMDRLRRVIDPADAPVTHPSSPGYATFRRHNNYKTRYGISLEQYEAMYDERNGLCDVCHEWFAKLCVDHCHASSIIRGLLCVSCNLSIGRMNDDAHRLRTAANYVERPVDGTPRAA